MHPPIPPHFLNIPYNGKNFPGSGIEDWQNGSNCQVFIYELLRHFGYVIPNHRSSELWEDEEFTKRVTALEPFDILFWHKEPKAWGAHIGLYWREKQVIHLSKKNNKPKIETLEGLSKLPEYQFFIGAKRPLEKKI